MLPFQRIIILTVLAGLGFGTGPEAAAQVKQVGQFKRWSANVIQEGRARTCYVHGAPVSMKGKYKSRGKAFLQVTHRPAEGTRDEVGITAGYRYLKDSEAIVVIDKRRFVLFTDRDTAWAKNAREDRKLVRALIKGRKMTVRAKSSRGTLTIDTYSLLGFTRAYRAIGRACKKR
jgi:Invasion associated locus B (IalB) protein